MSRRSSRSQRSSPVPPGSASRGARLRLERNERLPRPPRPPRASTQPVALAQHLAQSARPWPRRTATVPGGTCDQQVLAARARAVAGAAVVAALGAELGVVAQGKQGVLMGDGDEDDVAAVAADAAVGAAPGDVGLAAEADAAAAAVAALDEDLDPIDEHAPRPSGRAGRAAAGRA